MDILLHLRYKEIPADPVTFILDDEEAYHAILRMRYDGRDLTVKPWVAQKDFRVGYHYKPTVEEAERGMKLLKRYVSEPPREVVYPDCRQIRIVE